MAIQATYETRREYVKNTYDLNRRLDKLAGIEHKAPEKYSDVTALRSEQAYAYAFEYRMPPICHDDYRSEDFPTDPFESAYSISTELCRDLFKYFDDFYALPDKNKYDTAELEFYTIESYFSQKHNHERHHMRGKLLQIMRYCVLMGMFNEDLWKTVRRRAPAEADTIGNERDWRCTPFGW